MTTVSKFHSIKVTTDNDGSICAGAYEHSANMIVRIIGKDGRAKVLLDREEAIRFKTAIESALVTMAGNHELTVIAP